MIIETFQNFVAFCGALVALLKPEQGSGRFCSVDRVTSTGAVHRVQFKPGCSYENSLKARRDLADQMYKLQPFSPLDPVQVPERQMPPASPSHLIPAVTLTPEEKKAVKAGQDVPGLVILGNGHLRREVELVFEHCQAALIKIREDSARRLLGDLERASSYQPTGIKGVTAKVTGDAQNWADRYLSGWQMNSRVLVKGTPKALSYQNPVNVAMARLERANDFPAWRQLPLSSILQVSARGCTVRLQDGASNG